MTTPMRARRGHGRHDRGAAAVEFALILPILMMLVFAVIGFGFLFAQNLALSNSARQAARYGVVQNRSCFDLVAEAQASAQPLVALAPSGVVVTRGLNATAAAGNPRCASATAGAADASFPCQGSVAGDNIYVSLAYTANVLVPVVPGMGSTKNLSGLGVFRCEWSEVTP